jgi:hypothetical protein
VRKPLPNLHMFSYFINNNAKIVKVKSRFDATMACMYNLLNHVCAMKDTGMRGSQWL